MLMMNLGRLLKKSMQHFKRSIFTQEYEDDPQYCYFYNIFADEYLKFDAIHRKQILDQLDNPDEREENVYFRLLKEHALLVPIDRDEISLLDYQYQSLIYDSSHFTLTIIPTMNCNFRCMYCYEDKFPSRMSEETENHLIKYVRKNIRRFRSMELNWFGGEPLLEKDCVLRVTNAIVKICSQNGVSFTSSITTNGYLLTVDLFEKLYKSGIRYYQISLDGDKSLHESYRKYKLGESYDVIFQNLLAIQSLPYRRFQIGIRANIAKNSRPAVERLIADLSSNFSQDRRFLFNVCRISDWGGTARDNFPDSLLSDEEFLQESDYLLRMAQEAGLLVHDTSQLKVGGNVCEYRKKYSMVFYYDGNIYKCTLAVGNSENVVGRIDDSGNLHFTDRIVHWMDNSFDKTECRSCKLLAYCMRSQCPYHMGSHHECRIRKNITVERLLKGKNDWKYIAV